MSGAGSGDGVHTVYGAMNADLVRVGDVIIGKDGRLMRVLDVEHCYYTEGERTFDVRQILITLIAMESSDACQETEILSETAYPESDRPEDADAE